MAGGRHALEGSVAAYVYHDTDPNITRPGTFGAVVWIGSVKPDNMIDGDFWEDPSDSGESVEAYARVDGTRAFTAPVEGVTPTDPAHLTTKDYADGLTDDYVRQDGTTAFTAAQAGVAPTDADHLVTKSYADDLEYGLRQIVTFTSSGTFVKADYPWLRAVRVRVQAGGGSGYGTSSVPLNSGQCRGGGGGGAYAESLLDESVLGATETVTIGAGGVSTGSNSADGADSSFGAHVSAESGKGGSVRSSTSGTNASFGGGPGTSGTGQIVVPGGSGGNGVVVEGTALLVGQGGASVFGQGGRLNRGPASDNTVGTPLDGEGFGSGGQGGAAQGEVEDPVAAGNGAPGIVILELYG